MTDDKELAKVYEPHAVEDKWYRIWEKRGYFCADPFSELPSYTIVIPPPNVTGVLHIGHALNQTLQDIIIRHKRMSGFNTLWLPGMDHAGIATQNVVEKQLRARGQNREELGREQFVERVWKWKEASGGVILKQLRRLGSSVDWSRERFTMDEGLSHAVREVFVSLYKEGLIYQGDYMVNWCPQCMTALSDLEVEHEELSGRLYYIRYPVKGSDEYLVIATTRPETMLGDTAVAVHPDDRRLASLIGRSIVLPLINREIPVIADSYVDPEFGAGALKITPAHDPNDFDIGIRHNLENINVMDTSGCMNNNAGPYEGLDRFQCREKIINDLQEKDLIEKIDDYTHSVGHCYRCKTIIEPRVSRQWFVKTAPLAKPAIEAVRQGRVKFFPKSWENTYFNWMDNVKDWCISRQIWWGHQIPAWYCQDCHEINVFSTAPEVCAKCGSSDLKQETDVLDTWFSSALWPFSTLGWPDKTKEMSTFYPTTTLVTGFDILFFWVARMIMMAMKFTGDVPFKNVYIHALVRDSHGQKMSKSKGNVIDPISLMDKHGTDSLRFTFAAMASPGRDIKLGDERIAGYRNFMNKIWNSARFIMMNIDRCGIESLAYEDLNSADGLPLHDRWMLSKLQKHIEDTNRHLDAFRFDESANGMYHFLWHEFCDWYIELGKPFLTSENDAKSIKALMYTFETLLRLLHPVIPFITEEIWQKIPHSGESICIAPYPQSNKLLSDEEAESEMELLIDVISAVRTCKAEMDIPAGKRLNVIIKASSNTCRILDKGRGYIINMARMNALEIDPEPVVPEFCATSVVRDVAIFIPLKGLIDIDEEKSKIKKDIKKLDVELKKVTNKLMNEDFLKKAPREVVQKESDKEQEFLAKITKLTENLSRLT